MAHGRKDQGCGSGRIRCFCLDPDPVFKFLWIALEGLLIDEKGNNFLLKMIKKKKMENFQAQSHSFTDQNTR